MSNILLAIIVLLLVSIWQQLKEINERGKGHEQRITLWKIDEKPRA